ncbi:MAG: hypothetical protein K2J77_07490 [Oscillospiraceae bacterium]|nr:hypothetical protein [Oscillospiraceae bacterium]
MLRKIICLTLTAALLLLSGCAKNETSGSEMKTLAEIRAEKENVSELAEKCPNLNLTNTYFYVPEVDKLGGFTVDLTAPVEEREKLLFDTAEWLVGGTPDESELYYWNSREFKRIPYAECKDDPNRADYFSIDYRSDKIDMGIELWGSIYFIFKDYEDVPMTDTGNYNWIFSVQDTPVKKYDLIAGENADEVFELQGGEISVKDAVEIMKSELEISPFHLDGLKLHPKQASVYKLGGKYAVNTVFYYEYNGVLLDHHYYSTNLETDEYDFIKDYLTEDTSMARNDRIDQLFYARLGKFKPTDESFDKFISLERFLSMMSEKLTGNSRFTIDSVELLYGVERIYPEGFEAITKDEKVATHPSGLRSRPIWVAYLSQTGIQDAKQMCVWADALTGELKLYYGQEASEH